MAEKSDPQRIKILPSMVLGVLGSSNCTWGRAGVDDPAGRASWLLVLLCLLLIWVVAVGSELCRPRTHSDTLDDEEGEVVEPSSNKAMRHIATASAASLGVVAVAMLALFSSSSDDDNNNNDSGLNRADVALWTHFAVTVPILHFALRCLAAGRPRSVARCLMFELLRNCRTTMNYPYNPPNVAALLTAAAASCQLAVLAFVPGVPWITPQPDDSLTQAWISRVALLLNVPQPWSGLLGAAIAAGYLWVSWLCRKGRTINSAPVLLPVLGDMLMMPAAIALLTCTACTDAEGAPRVCSDGAVAAGGGGGGGGGGGEAAVLLPTLSCWDDPGHWFVSGCAVLLCAVYLGTYARCQVEAQLVNRDHHGLEIVFMPDYLTVLLVARLGAVLLVASPLRMTEPLMYTSLLCFLNVGILAIVLTKQHSVTNSVWPSSIPLVNTGLRLGFQVSALCSVAAVVAAADSSSSNVAVTVLCVGALLLITINLIVHNFLAIPDETVAEQQNQVQIIEEQQVTIDGLSSKLSMFEARLRSLEHTGASHDSELGLGHLAGGAGSPVSGAPLGMHLTVPPVRAITPVSRQSLTSLDRQGSGGTGTDYDSDASTTSTCSHTSTASQRRYRL